jgi:hypothetical protein
MYRVLTDEKHVFLIKKHFVDLQSTHNRFYIIGKFEDICVKYDGKDGYNG